jgi:hypothetical protein
VSTVPHAHVTGTGLGIRHTARADAAGDRALRFWVGAATPGVRAVIHVHVAQHGQKASCNAVLRPRPVAPIPAPPTAAPQPTGCYPLTNGGNCYQPGEFCRTSDHGASGIDANGDPIVCEDNNGWRWEPA